MSRSTPQLVNQPSSPVGRTTFLKEEKNRCKRTVYDVSMRIQASLNHEKQRISTRAIWQRARPLEHHRNTAPTIFSFRGSSSKKMSRSIIAISVYLETGIAWVSTKTVLGVRIIAYREKSISLPV